MSIKDFIYDFIIVGAGAAGSVLAARLGADKKYSVLLLEAGQDNTQTSNTISPYQQSLINVQTNYAKAWSRYHVNPQISQCNGYEASPTMFEFATVKENTRYYTYPRGCGAGGSTNNHAMYDGRGTPVIYNRIAKFVKNNLWSYENILQYYKKMENYQVNKLNPDLHGYTGWLPINTTGPIDKDLRGKIIGLLGKKYNVPYRTDPADPKQVTGAYLPETQGKDNVRANAFKNLLTPMLPSCPNITVKFNSQVGKIIIKKYKKSKKSKSKLRAIGVEVYEKPYIQEYNITGNKLNAKCDVVIPNKDLPPVTKYYARKEVIICGGSIIVTSV